MTEATSSERNRRSVETFLNEKQVALRWACSVKLIQKMRYAGGGAPFVKLNGSMIRYRLSDLITYEDAQSRSSTSA